MTADAEPEFPPLQITGVDEMLSVIAPDPDIFTDAEAVQPLLSVTVTE